VVEKAGSLWGESRRTWRTLQSIQFNHADHPSGWTSIGIDSGLARAVLRSLERGIINRRTLLARMALNLADDSFGDDPMTWIPGRFRWAQRVASLARSRAACRVSLAPA
jgi:hypothetical protein